MITSLRYHQGIVKCFQGLNLSSRHVALYQLSVELQLLRFDYFLLQSSIFNLHLS